MLKVKFHSIVDVITNSSTTIFVYQDSIKEAKELIQEVLKLSGIKETVDDLFWFGVFHDNDAYLDYIDDMGEAEFEELEELEKEFIKSFPTHEDWKTQYKLRNKWIEELKVNIIKGKIEEPEWMKDGIEYGYDYV